MADSFTSNYSLILPEYNTPNWGSKLNYDFTELDSIIKALSDVSGATANTEKGIFLNAENKFEAQIDNSTIDFNASGQLRVKNNGVTNTQLGANSVQGINIHSSVYDNTTIKKNGSNQLYVDLATLGIDNYSVDEYDYVIDVNGTVGTNCDYTNIPATLVENKNYLIKAGNYTLTSNVTINDNVVLDAKGKVNIDCNSHQIKTPTASYTFNGTMSSWSGTSMTFGSSPTPPASYNYLYAYNTDLSSGIYKVTNISGTVVTVNESNPTTYDYATTGWYIRQFYKIIIRGDITVSGSNVPIALEFIYNSVIEITIKDTYEDNGIGNGFWFNSLVKAKIHNCDMGDSLFGLFLNNCVIDMLVTNSSCSADSCNINGARNSGRVIFENCLSTNAADYLCNINSNSSNITVISNSSIGDYGLLSDNTVNSSIKFIVNNSSTTNAASGNLISVNKSGGEVNIDLYNCYSAYIMFYLNTTNTIVTINGNILESDNKLMDTNASCSNTKHYINLSDVLLAQDEMTLNGETNLYDINANDITIRALNNFIRLVSTQSKLTLCSSGVSPSVLLGVDGSGNILDVTDNSTILEYGVSISGNYNSYRVNKGGTLADINISGDYNVGVGCIYNNYSSSGIGNLLSANANIDLP